VYYTYDLLQLLTDYYKAYIERYASVYEVYNETEWVDMINIITRIKNMTERFVNNLMDSTLKDFERDATNQLKNANTNSGNMRQLLYKIKDEAIKKFEKLERGLYDIYCAAFDSI
jgi:hypothetical protein